MPVPVSIIILTWNEETNLSACIDSLTGFDDITILDSGSTDETRRIAFEKGIPFVVNSPFLGFGTQRNWAIDNIAGKYDWSFHLDADERMTPRLAAELTVEVERQSVHGGYWVPSKLMLAGQWLKHAGQYPGYQVRFFHKKRLRFIDYGHGQREYSQYTIGKLREPIIHNGFSKGIDHWLSKHVIYARREAEAAMDPTKSGPNSIWSRNPIQRRRAVKRLVSKLPARYILRLFYVLVWKGGILDGWAGVTYAHMLATYEAMIGIYLRFSNHGISFDNLNADSATLFSSPH